MSQVTLVFGIAWLRYYSAIDCTTPASSRSSRSPAVIAIAMSPALRAGRARRPPGAPPPAKRRRNGSSPLYTTHYELLPCPEDRNGRHWVRVELSTILIKYAFKIAIQFWSRRDNSVMPLA